MFLNVKRTSKTISWLLALVMLFCSSGLMVNACAENAYTTLIDETKQSIAPYLSILGTDTKGGSLSVSQSFIDNIDKVVLMGNMGTIEHGYTESASGIIDIMDWYSNDDFSNAQFESFVLLMNEFFGTNGSLQSYSNISDRTYVWVDRENLCMVLCWLEDKTIDVRWYYEEDYLTEEAEPTATPTATPKATATPKPTSKPSGSKITRYCEVDGCYKEGKYPFSILGLPDEYYCKEHYDEMMDIMDMMEEDVGSGSYSKHTCEVDGCYKEGSRSIVGIYGFTEYYCSEHYYDMKEMLDLFGW